MRLNEITERMLLYPLRERREGFQPFPPYNFDGVSTRQIFSHQTSGVLDMRKASVYRGFGEGVGEMELGGLGGLDARFEPVA